MTVQWGSNQLQRVITLQISKRAKIQHFTVGKAKSTFWKWPPQRGNDWKREQRSNDHLDLESAQQEGRAGKWEDHWAGHLTGSWEQSVHNFLTTTWPNSLNHNVHVQQQPSLMNPILEVNQEEHTHTQLKSKVPHIHGQLKIEVVHKHMKSKDPKSCDQNLLAVTSSRLSTWLPRKGKPLWKVRSTQPQESSQQYHLYQDHHKGIISICQTNPLNFPTTTRRKWPGRSTSSNIKCTSTQNIGTTRDLGGEEQVNRKLCTNKDLCLSWWCAQRYLPKLVCRILSVHLAHDSNLVRLLQTQRSQPHDS